MIALPFRRALFVGLLGCIAVVVLLRSESADVSTGSAARAVASSHRPRAPANLTPRTRAELTRELKISQIERNGELGVYVQPLEGGAPYRYGPLQSGRTWSVIKVPLVVAFLRWRAAANGVRNGSRVLTRYERGEIEQTIRNSDNRAARHLYNLMAQRFGLYVDLTVEENMRFYADLFGIVGSEYGELSARLLRMTRRSKTVYSESSWPRIGSRIPRSPSTKGSL